MGELVEGEGKRVGVWAFYVFQGVLISKKRERFAVKTQSQAFKEGFSSP